MTKIYCESYEIPSADMGERNRMADIKNISYIHAGYQTSEHFDEKDKKYLGKGMLDTMLPYMQQDGYDRDLKPKKWNAVILENEKLKAVFLPELGGRLWSLFDKKVGRELLYVNKVFEPCNLALRNAWFSGGVEWNVGIKGHNPLTASPVFTAYGRTAEGDPVVSFYEYERIREVVYGVNAVLPDDSDMLYIKTTIENTKDTPQYMYWWSNIAVAEVPGLRIVSPADETILCHYNEGCYTLDRVPFPQINGKDLSYPENAPVVTDYFYKLRPDADKWIAAVDGDGYGLLQTSDAFLGGRKLFAWGQKPGGRNWASFLAGGKNESYVEIQAGILTTQLEHIPMPGSTVWQWTETYGAVSMDRTTAHGDWHTVTEAVADTVRKIPQRKITLFPPERIVTVGDGWGYLESLNRKISAIYDFSRDSVTSEQTEWLELIGTGTLREADVREAPSSFLTADWAEKLLRNAVKNGADHWNTLYHLGVCRYAHGDLAAAEQFWKQSVEKKINAWACRNLAVLYYREYHDTKQAVEWIEKGYSAGGKQDRGFLYDMAEICNSSGADGACRMIAVFGDLPEKLQRNGRLRLELAKAYILLDRLAEAKNILNDSFEMADVREGEVSISQVWFDLYGKILVHDGIVSAEELTDAIVNRFYPLPKHLDFRMN